jgi:hypothetical protein
LTYYYLFDLTQRHAHDAFCFCILQTAPAPYNYHQNISTMPKSMKDPGSPKRNMSAYLLYQNAMREQFKAQNPGMTFGQLSKFTSAMYAELTPAEKEVWQARAEADKARYLRELASYVPPPGYDSKGDAIVNTAPPSVPIPPSGYMTMPMPAYTQVPMTAPYQPVVKRGKGGKDLGAPKRNVGAYLLYQNAMRDHFKAENPEMTFGQLSKYTSHMYKNLSPAERAVWEERARQDKERYKAEMSGYVPPSAYIPRGHVPVPEHHVVASTSTKQRAVAKSAPKDPNAPKRARGSYVCFTFEMRPKIMEEYPGIKFVEMGSILGERWRNLPPEEKKRYEEMAAQDKARFNAEMQQYQAQQEQAQKSQPPQQVHQMPYAQTNHQFYHEDTQAQYAAPQHSYEQQPQHYQAYDHPHQYDHTSGYGYGSEYHSSM